MPSRYCDVQDVGTQFDPVIARIANRRRAAERDRNRYVETAGIQLVEELRWLALAEGDDQVGVVRGQLVQGRGQQTRQSRREGADADRPAQGLVERLQVVPRVL